jgi:hypothetical protein
MMPSVIVFTNCMIGCSKLRTFNRRQKNSFFAQLLTTFGSWKSKKMSSVLICIFLSPPKVARASFYCPEKATSSRGLRVDGKHRAHIINSGELQFGCFQYLKHSSSCSLARPYDSQLLNERLKIVVPEMP